eukprot:COSAG04_NODE_150_length_22521_cov_10.008385_3_plen_250_part_00
MPFSFHKAFHICCADRLCARSAQIGHQSQQTDSTLGGVDRVCLRIQHMMPTRSARVVSAAPETAWSAPSPASAPPYTTHRSYRPTIRRPSPRPRRRGPFYRDRHRHQPRRIGCGYTRWRRRSRRAPRRRRYAAPLSTPTAPPCCPSAPSIPPLRGRPAPCGVLCAQRRPPGRSKTRATLPPPGPELTATAASGAGAGIAASRPREVTRASLFAIPTTTRWHRFSSASTPLTRDAPAALREGRAAAPDAA